MSITVPVPPELEAQVRAIPDLDERLLNFLRHQVSYEDWRRQRYSERARQIVSRGLADAEHLPQSGVSREEMFNRLFDLLEPAKPQG